MPKTFLALLFYCFSASILSAQHGTLDPNFGNGGLALTQYTAGFHGGLDLSLQPDGKILVAGVSSDSLSRLTVYRYLPDGNPDIAFGDSGVAKLVYPHYSSWGNRLALQPDGKIVVAGMITLEHLGLEDLAVARFLPDGQPDVSFGNSGVVSVNVWGPREYPFEIAIQPDGNIMVAGFAYDTLYFQHALLARFRSNGTLDASFGNDGLLLLSHIDDLGANVNVVRFQGEKILMGLGYFTGSQDYTLIRLNLDGTPDLAFGVNGLAIYDFGYTERITSIVVQPDGKIVVAGDSEGNIPQVGIARLLSDGQLDTEFGDGGSVVVKYGDLRCDPGGLALQPDGKILLSVVVPVGASDDFGLVRLLPSGTFDNTFGDKGKVRTTFGDNSYDYGFSVAVQPDHKIIVSGYSSIGSSYAVAMTRYLSNYDLPPVDTNALEKMVKIYPNPTSGDVTLEFWLSKETTVSLDLYDAQGRLLQNLLHSETRAADAHTEPLSLGDIVAAGVYFLALTKDGQRRYLPVVKE